MLSQDDGCHSVEQQLRPSLWNERLTCQFSVEVSPHGVNGSLTASCQPVRTNLDFQWTEDDFQRRDEEMHFPAHSVIINIFIIRSKSASSLFNFFLHGGSHETKTYQIAGGHSYSRCRPCAPSLCEILSHFRGFWSASQKTGTATLSVSWEDYTVNGEDQPQVKFRSQQQHFTCSERKTSSVLSSSEQVWTPPPQLSGDTDSD
ncbi:hypothetical protein FQA47_009612 [Oryzias melastigma]|uniref:Uncharacterized protein n=1 Tax=Oryzias melastigma TaxID=30732 RepID=A0A834F3Q7_ORYME|nr:hypothetical protein FQA47_009612 [Oryzias melastigma]